MRLDKYLKVSRLIKRRTVANEITDGVADTHFAPDDNCTRAHIVTFLYRAVA